MREALCCRCTWLCVGHRASSEKAETGSRLPGTGLWALGSGCPHLESCSACQGSLWPVPSAWRFCWCLSPACQFGFEFGSWFPVVENRSCCCLLRDALPKANASRSLFCPSFNALGEGRELTLIWCYQRKPVLENSAFHVDWVPSSSAAALWEISVGDFSEVFWVLLTAHSHTSFYPFFFSSPFSSSSSSFFIVQI